MANNRMFLIHKPSKLGIMLGKRMGYGWYNAPEADRLNDFYEYLAESVKGEQDNFVLAMESCEGGSCFTGWNYTGEYENGFRVFEFVGNEE